MVDVIVLDFDAEKAALGEPINDGTYKLQVSKAESGISKKGNPKIHVELDIVDDPMFNSRRLYDDISLTQAAAWKLVQFCKAAGVKPQNIVLAELVGRTVYADVVSEPFGEDDDGNPKMSPKIAKYRQTAA